MSPTILQTEELTKTYHVSVGLLKGRKSLKAVNGVNG